MTYAVVRAPRLDLDEFAAAACLHPELVRRCAILRQRITDHRRRFGRALYFFQGGFKDARLRFENSDA